MRDDSPSCPEREFPNGPLRLAERRVAPDWIDYNGHMNVAYYVVAFDKAFDEVLEEWIGVGESFVARARMGPMALQSQNFYLGELVEGEAFGIETRLIDFDRKRVHFYGEMLKGDGSLAATYESLSLNVDLETRRSAAYPDWAQARLQKMFDAQAHLPRPERLGAPIGIRRKG